MEPRNDSELRDLLREWQTPELSPSLETRVLGPRGSWWHFLLRGYIRVPVPVACCLALLLIAAGWRLTKPAPVGPCSAARIDQQKTAAGTSFAPALSRSPSTSCSVDSSC